MPGPHFPYWVEGTTVKLRRSAKVSGTGSDERAKVVRVLVCPKCGGTDVVYTYDRERYRKSRCNDCGYAGSFVIERKLVVGEDGTVKEA